MHLGDTPHDLTESDFETLGHKTEGFSGSDISVCVSIKPNKVISFRLLAFFTFFLFLNITIFSVKRSKMSFLNLFGKPKMPCFSLD